MNIINSFSQTSCTFFPQESFFDSPVKFFNSNQMPPVSNIKDPINGQKLPQTGTTLLFYGQGFFPISIAEHLVRTDRPYFKNNKELLYKNQEEYKSLINNLIITISNESYEFCEQEYQEDLVMKLKLKLANFEEAHTYIEKFELESGFQFLTVLEAIKNLMANLDIYGANSIATDQKTGFNFYMRVLEGLPENLRPLIFPSYAFDPSDSQCISSTSKIFEQQIQRLALLNLGHKKTETDLSEQSIENSVLLIEKFGGKNPQNDSFRTNLFNTLYDTCNVTTKEIVLNGIKYPITLAQLKESPPNDFLATLELYVTTLIESPDNDNHTIQELHQIKSNSSNFTVSLQQFILKKIEECNEDIFETFFEGVKADLCNSEAEIYGDYAESVMTYSENTELKEQLRSFIETPLGNRMSDKNLLEKTIGCLTTRDAKLCLEKMFNNQPQTCFSQIESILGFKNSDLLFLKDQTLRGDNTDIGRVRVYIDLHSYCFGILQNAE